ncbi:MAG: sugar transferase [Deferribacterales bacterium]
MQNSFYKRYGKRLLDIVISIIGLIVLLPFFIVIGVLIKVDSKGPILFRQIRVGKDFKPFFLYKFRTMIVGADKIGPLVTRDYDPRITKIGRFLRKTKLDELPQLFNVLMGDMSVVGPRPEVEKYVEAKKDDYKFIITIKPGITDYAAIEFTDEEEILAKYENIDEGYIKEILPKKIELYKRYIKEVSFMVDMKIIAMTLYKIIKR